MKSPPSPGSFEDRIRSLLAQVPFVRIEEIRREPAGVAKGTRPDLVCKLAVDDAPWTLVIEAKSPAYPRHVRDSISRLKHITNHVPANSGVYGVVMAPFLSPESIAICREAGVGCVDLAGNACLNFDHVFIRTETSGNPFREKRELRSLFTPKAERILQVLLAPPIQAWKVTELAGKASVSLGHVSNIRKLLIDREWARADARGVRLSDPAALVRAWGDAYRRRVEATLRFYTTLHGEALAEAVKAAQIEAGRGTHLVLASFSAASWLAPYVRHATRFFYADEGGLESLLGRLQLKEISRGENVVVFVPKADDVFASRIEPAPDVWCTADVRTWLDLQAAGDRGRDAADHLLNQRLLKAWGAAEA